MLSVTECLAKASEMETRGAKSPTLALRAEYLDAAIRWRDLARRALIHGHVDITGEESPADSGGRSPNSCKLLRHKLLQCAQKLPDT